MHREEALRKADNVRIARGLIKKRIFKGEVSVVDVVMNPPEDLRDMALFEVLLAQKRWGRMRVVKFLEKNDLSEYLGLQSMTERQRKIVAHAITTLTWPPERSSYKAG
jgi:hypothetical protein